MNGSVTNAARALEEYTVAVVELRRARLARRDSSVRAADVLELANHLDNSMGSDAIDLVDLLVEERLRTERSVRLPAEMVTEARSLEQKARSAVGVEVADAIVHMVDAATATRAVEVRGVVTANEPAYYTGVWDSKAVYGRNAMTTDRGTLWFCEADNTSDRPGTSAAWRLMVKTHPKQDRMNAGATR